MKRALGTRSVGHTGTLDQFAEGLLLVLAGWATRLTDYCHRLDKTYEARVRLGVQTDTLDPEGDILHRGPVPDSAQIDQVLQQFTGSIQQVPPRYSAIHVGGVRASQLMRSGGEPVLSPRRVQIHELSRLPDAEPDPDSLAGPTPAEGTLDFRIRVRCGTGTYIRALARDIASSLGTVGMLMELRRTDIGPFGLAMATRDPAASALRNPRDLLAVIPEMVEVHLTTAQEFEVAKGIPAERIPGLSELVEASLAEGSRRELALIGAEGSVRAVVRLSEAGPSYHFVVPGSPG